jgi:peptidoglycan/LPS O-acetylase OafA/YrhL
MVKLNDLATGRDNNFNLLRMIAASAVLVSHAYPIALGEGAIEPLSSMLRMSLGTLAVLTFFSISGFFISQSFERGHGLIGFCVARILRIYPGLMVVLLLTILVIGPVFTTLTQSSYFFHPATLLYFPRNISLKWLQYDLPGVFRDNPYGPAINGSLWSLFYEVACYCVVVVIGVLPLTGRSWTFIAFLVVYALGYVALKLIGDPLLKQSALIANFHQLTLPFVVGMAFYHFRRFLPLNFIVCAVACGGVVLAYGHFWFEEIFVICWCYLIFYLGYLSCAPLKAYNHVGDYSYGMYIYAFPCEQIGAALWKGASPLALIAISFPLTLAFAVLSWHFLENWALGYRATAAQWLKRKIMLQRGWTSHRRPLSSESPQVRDCCTLRRR